MTPTDPDLDDYRERCERVLRQQWPGTVAGPLSRFATGRSSLTYRCDVGGAPVAAVVVKVAVPGLLPVRNRDVLRQAALLDVLSGVPGLRVPHVYGADAGNPPAVPPLFVMELLPGESLEPLHAPSGTVRSASDVAGRARSAAGMLAALHGVRPDAQLLAQAATRDLPAEVGHWAEVLASCPMTAARSRLHEQIRTALLASVPEGLPPSVLHGDWRLGNMQCDSDQVHGVIDWEIWSVGDPRLDLGWFLMWCDPEHPLAAGGGFPLPSAEGVLTEYERRRDQPVVDLAWFAALARYKQAATCALLVKNAHKRGDPDPRFVALDQGLEPLFDSALLALGGGGVIPASLDE